MTPARPVHVEPFTLRDGDVFLEDVRVAELVGGLHGREAWLISHAAIAAALHGALATGPGGGARTVAVADVGPHAVLAQCAAAGCWARVASSHELELAREAGFLPERIVAGAAVVEDGFLRDALTAGVAAIERTGSQAEANLLRIAAALGHPVPPAAGAPADLPGSFLARCGGLLAPVLAGPPALAVSAAWDPPEAAVGGPGPALLAALAVTLPVTLPDEALEREVTVRGLGAAPAEAARLHGSAERGEWIVLVAPGAAAVHRPDPGHPLPLLVLVRGAAWRPLNPRRLPPMHEP